MPPESSDITDEFRKRMKSRACPACRAAFTDYAINWGWGWFHGYRDRLAEEGVDMRDGPFKPECESCGRRSWYKLFEDSVSLVDEQRSG